MQINANTCHSLFSLLAQTYYSDSIFLCSILQKLLKLDTFTQITCLWGCGYVDNLVHLIYLFPRHKLLTSSISAQGFDGRLGSSWNKKRSHQDQSPWSQQVPVVFGWHAWVYTWKVLCEKTFFWPLNFALALCLNGLCYLIFLALLTDQSLRWTGKGRKWALLVTSILHWQGTERSLDFLILCLELRKSHI